MKSKQDIPTFSSSVLIFEFTETEFKKKGYEHLVLWFMIKLALSGKKVEKFFYQFSGTCAVLKTGMKSLLLEK